MHYLNTKKSIFIERSTDTSIKYGIRDHRYDMVKTSFIETNVISSVLHLGYILPWLLMTCIVSVYGGGLVAFALGYCSYILMLFISILFLNAGVDFFLVTLNRGLDLFIPWLLSVPGLYVLTGLIVICSIIVFGDLVYETPNMAGHLYAIPACLYSLATFPVVTAINMFLFINDAVFCSAHYFMDCFDTRPAHECLAEYLNQNPDIKSIHLQLEQEEALDLKQLRSVVDSVPSSVEKIIFDMPVQPYSSETTNNLFKAFNSGSREKISFNTQELTDKWDVWQNAHTFRTLEQTREPGRPRLNQDVIKYGIFSYLEPSEINNMFDALSPQV